MKREYDGAFSLLEGILELQPDNSSVYYNIACLYAKQNLKDKSVIWLRRAIKKGFDNLDIIKSDEDLKNIRDTEYYRELIGSS